MPQTGPYSTFTTHQDKVQVQEKEGGEARSTEVKLEYARLQAVSRSRPGNWMKEWEGLEKLDMVWDALTCSQSFFG